MSGDAPVAGAWKRAESPRAMPDRPRRVYDDIPDVRSIQQLEQTELLAPDEYDDKA